MSSTASGPYPAVPYATVPCLGVQGPAVPWSTARYPSAPYLVEP
ncbi:MULTISPECIES: hypothetical protein [Streptomyces]|uniref:Uncharacterized protein n=1 Tax=Streptomyces clavifer TaxID=68188 RepID=A0ABS4V4J9_9ACTN|nr:MULTISPECIES: hypothetical protein [Streptomyces]MBP2358772.1 hypothetical protein [Streptomyces clavifer]MDX2747518.1 hypothetical protein [Streptomyces sp. NRRL_B-2557]MDX3060721.1 hypothetical protein [Streptomyces sp. ND04-05B]WRY86975.1 hypothetical protein OG388_26085 [Streptomyces clavifer]WUC30216.1 hypothetical protein OG927_23985 [Streptomyces clavifer]